MGGMDDDDLDAWGDAFDWDRANDDDLEWTKTPPSAIGYYWASRPHLIGSIVKPVEVGMNDAGEFGAFEAGWGEVLPITNYTHWLGPLPVPEPAKE